MLDAWLGGLEHPPHAGGRYVVSVAGEVYTELDRAADNVAKRLAFAVAVQQLIHGGILLAAPGDPIDTTHIPFVVILPNADRRKMTLKGGPYGCALPGSVFRAPTSTTQISNPALYLGCFTGAELHPGIVVALEESVACFVAHLFLPCMAMLCTAAEGAWIELARRAGGSKSRALAESETASLRKLVATVIDELKSTRDGGVRRRLDEAQQWTLVLQDARNAVHYANEPVTRSDYEKAAALLLGAPTHFATLYGIQSDQPDEGG